MNLFTVIAPIYNMLFPKMQERHGKQLVSKLSPLEGSKVLDLGGGTGKIASQMMASGADVWLLDSSPQMVRQAQSVLPADRVVLADALSIPFMENAFDIITVVDVFHHIRKQKDVLKECRRVLKPYGLICFLEFNPDCFSMRVLAGIERLLGEPSLFLTPGDLALMLEDAGFQVIEADPVSCEYLILAKKPEGLEV
ncbi:class I SAM-dependent methyltransferase [Dethiobacter alkaliphilus]|uniref:class I SAM-dependent methyltransferase n=1 Tax=Dethiobacter alkaliphilus TaxID=427926 RepID=UPI00222683DD|nr:methyltransferase domain-containing protein [Dethiobacter alkaliphilus]MCW3491716.1 methyltransferase domain-containing protein [Dethiobacter alkaliphilus]